VPDKIRERFAGPGLSHVKLRHRAAFHSPFLDGLPLRRGVCISKTRTRTLRFSHSARNVIGPGTIGPAWRASSLTAGKLHSRAILRYADPLVASTGIDKMQSVPKEFQYSRTLRRQGRMGGRLLFEVGRQGAESAGRRTAFYLCGLGVRVVRSFNPEPTARPERERRPR
jgi:hypothetical protein